MNDSRELLRVASVQHGMSKVTVIAIIAAIGAAACKHDATPLAHADDASVAGPGPLDFEGEIELKSNAGYTKTVYVVKNDKARFGPFEAYGDVIVIDTGKKKLDSLTPYDKTYFEGSLGGARSLVPKPTATKTGKTDKVAGHSCDEWQIIVPPTFKTLTCIASDVSAPGLTGSDGPFRLLDGHAVMEVVGSSGVPLRTEMFDASGSPYITLEVTRIEKKSEPDSDFEVPAGYTLRTELRRRRPNE